MSVSVQHDGMTITSTSNDADAVLAGLKAADAAVAPPAETPPPAPTQPAAPIAGAEEPEATSESPAEGAEPPQPRSATGQFQSKHKKGSAEWRIAQKHWELEQTRRELEQERQQRAREREELQRQQPQAPKRVPADPQAPKIDEYESYDDFMRDTASYYAQKIGSVQALEFAKEQQSIRNRLRFDTLASEFSKTVDDFHQVMHTMADLKVSRAMEAAIHLSPHAPAIAYFLGTHPEEAHQLLVETQDYDESTAPLVRRLLEARLSTPAADAAPKEPAQPPAVVRPSLPAPIKPVGSGATVAETPPENLPFGKAYVDAMNAKELAQYKAKLGR